MKRRVNIANQTSDQLELELSIDALNSDRRIAWVGFLIFTVATPLLGGRYLLKGIFTVEAVMVGATLLLFWIVSIYAVWRVERRWNNGVSFSFQKNSGWFLGNQQPLCRLEDIEFKQEKNDETELYSLSIRWPQRKRPLYIDSNLSKQEADWITERIAAFLGSPIQQPSKETQSEEAVMSLAFLLKVYGVALWKTITSGFKKG